MQLKDEDHAVFDEAKVDEWQALARSRRQNEYVYVNEYVDNKAENDAHLSLR